MTEITINERLYRMEYNFLTALTFQRMTGKDPFRDVANVEDMAILGYSMLLANNEEPMPTFNELFVSMNDTRTMQAFLLAVRQETERFFHVAEGDDPAASKEEAEAVKKN